MIYFDILFWTHINKISKDVELWIREPKQFEFTKFGEIISIQDEYRINFNMACLGRHAPKCVDF